MLNIKVLGSGCSKCKIATQLIEQIAAELKVSIELEKVEDMRAIISYGVMSTPAVVIDGKVVHVGSVPDRALIVGWLS